MIQYVLLYSVVLTFSSVLYCGTVCFTIQCGSNFFICGSNHGVWTFYGKLLNSTVLWYCLFYYTVWFLLFHLWIKPCSVTILCKVTEQYCTVVLFVLLYSVIITFSSVDQTIQCDRSLESYWTVLYCVTVCFTIQCGSNIFICGSNHAVWPFFRTQLDSTVPWNCSSMTQTDVELYLYFTLVFINAGTSINSEYFSSYHTRSSHPPDMCRNAR